MSSYLKIITNPRSGKTQRALCHDDHYGEHKYGYCFKKDGSDFTLEEIIKNGLTDDCVEWFTHEEMLIN